MAHKHPAEGVAELVYLGEAKTHAKRAVGARDGASQWLAVANFPPCINHLILTLILIFRNTLTFNGLTVIL